MAEGDEEEEEMEGKTAKILWWWHKGEELRCKQIHHSILVQRQEEWDREDGEETGGAKSQGIEKGEKQKK